MSLGPASIHALPTLCCGNSHDKEPGSPAVRAANCEPRASLSSASALMVPEWPVATCNPWNTGNQLFASETRSIGHDASTNRNCRFPGLFPHRDCCPILTVFGVPKLPHTMMKSGFVEVGGFWQLPWPANKYISGSSEPPLGSLSPPSRKSDPHTFPFSHVVTAMWPANSYQARNFLASSMVAGRSGPPQPFGM